jgi:hypothetical protein
MITMDAQVSCRNPAPVPSAFPASPRHFHCNPSFGSFYTSALRCGSARDIILHSPSRLPTPPPAPGTPVLAPRQTITTNPASRYSRDVLPCSVQSEVHLHVEHERELVIDYVQVLKVKRIVSCAFALCSIIPTINHPGAKSFPAFH